MLVFKNIQKKKTLIFILSFICLISKMSQAGLVLKLFRIKKTFSVILKPENEQPEL